MSGLTDWPLPESLGRSRTCTAGTMLLRQGEPFQCLYWIEAGLVRVSALKAGGQEVLLAVRRPGWLLGAVSAVTGNSPVGSAVTWTTCVVRPMPIGTFQNLRTTDLSVGGWVQRMLASEAEEQARRTAAMVGAPVRLRLERVLHELLRDAAHRRADGSRCLVAHVSVTELARLAVTSREEASRLISQFVREGLLARDRDWLVAPAGSPLLLYPSDEN